jgi:hypothetical protein
MSWSSQWSPSFWISHQKPICIPLLFRSCYMIRPSHPPLLVVLIILWEEYKSRSSLLYCFLHSPVTSSLFGPNILLSTVLKHPQSIFYP